MADYINREHGHWITTKIVNKSIYPHIPPSYRFSHKCSNCNFEIVDYIGYIDLSCCLICGAKMDEVTE